MGDRTRAGSCSSGAAEAFAVYVEDWLDQFGSLIGALVTLRLMGDEPEACSGLLEQSEVRMLREAWELWGLFADTDIEALATRLVPFLGAEQVGELVFGLWGDASTVPEES